MFPFDRIFFAHPRSVGESYRQHWLQAMTISVRLLRGGGAALIHAFVPCMFKVTASSLVIGMANELAARRRLAGSGAGESGGVRTANFDASKQRESQS